MVALPENILSDERHLDGCNVDQLVVLDELDCRATGSCSLHVEGTLFHFRQLNHQARSCLVDDSASLTANSQRSNVVEVRASEADLSARHSDEVGLVDDDLSNTDGSGINECAVLDEHHAGAALSGGLHGVVAIGQCGQLDHQLVGLLADDGTGLTVDSPSSHFIKLTTREGQLSGQCADKDRLGDNGLTRDIHDATTIRHAFSIDE